MPETKPIYLFADSQLLFWNTAGTVFLQSLLYHIHDSKPCAAYIGASNGDRAEFYEIFLAAMQGIGLQDCRMIRSEFSTQDRDYLSQASLILLAGGDPRQGWQVIQKTGMQEIIQQRYQTGALLLGISAGAMQLGCSIADRPIQTAEQIDGFNYVPWLIGCHEEKEHWIETKRFLLSHQGSEKALGIPSGGGCVYEPSRGLRAIRKPLIEFHRSGKHTLERLIYPKPDQTVPYLKH